jgi:ATP-binding cassette, subfamily B, bacterial PglK
MFKALKKLNQILDKRSKNQFGLLFILLIIKSFLDGLGLGLIAPYITAIADSSVIFNHIIFKKINTFINIDSSQELIVFLSLFLIVFFILKNSFSLFIMYYQSRLVFTKRSFQGETLFKSYMKAPYSYHLDHNTAELDRNIRYESTNVYGFVQSFLLLSSNLFLTISIFIVLLVANWQTVLLMGFVITIFSLIFLSFSGRLSKKYGIEAQVSQLHIGQAIKEGLSSIIESKLHNIESFFPARYFKHMMLNARANWRQATLGVGPALFFEILAVSSLVGVIIVLSIRNIDINKIIPILGLFSFAFIRLIPSVTAIIKNLQDIKFLSPAVDVVHSDLEKINNLINKSNLENRVETDKTSDFVSLIIKNLSFSFKSKNKQKVIDNLNIQINKGQAIGITGPSGSGKTTLVNIILGLLKPLNGEVLLNNVTIYNNISKWHSMIGYVPQAITLIDASIKENIALGFEGDKIIDKKVWDVLKEASLEDFIKSLPDQIDTVIGENGMRLSGGQRQRLGLARTLYRNPDILIFDEATSALDVDTEKKITHEIMKLSGTRTLIIVAHRLSTIKDCNKIYYLKDGKIVNSGSFNELKKINNDFKKISNQSEVSFD